MKQITLLLCVFLNISAFSQVGIGTVPDNSAILDLSTVTKGILVPRLSTLDMNGISDPATGLLIFNVTDNLFYYNAGTPSSINWLPFFAPGVNDTVITNIAWGLSGNSNVDENTNFIGTTDTMNLAFKVNNKTWGTIDGNNNFLGVGLTNPFAPITIFDGTKTTTDSNTTDAAMYVVRSAPGGSTARDAAIVGQATGKGSSSISNIHSFFAIASYDGIDTMRNLTGYTAVINNDSNGVVEDARGLNVSWSESDIIVNPLAEILDGYGVYISDVKATNGFGVFQVGVDDANHFAGNTGIGVGSATPTSTLEVKGSLSLNFRQVTTSYMITESDYTISITPTNPIDTVTIPTAAADNKGRIYMIKRDAPVAGNSVVVRTNDAQVIDGVLNVFLNDAYQRMTVQSTGAKWIRID